MNQLTHLYHGSPIPFGTVRPKHNIRFKKVQGTKKVQFNQKSFHATPERWIALSYMCDTSFIDFLPDGRPVRYSVGVDLYDNTHIVNIYGLHSLENSLERLYSNGGYLYSYSPESFYQANGLGTMEYISTQAIEPIKEEHIVNPIETMKDLGVTYNFIDIASIADSNLMSLFLVDSH